MNLLPILQPHIDPMSLCNICPSPGHCCKKFAIPSLGTFPVETWRELVQAALDKEGLPFSPLEYEANELMGDDIEATNVWLTCSHLTTLGRCSIYETRPNTCKSFVPGSDPLCVFIKPEGVA